MGSRLQRLGVELPLRTPMAGQVVPAVAIPLRQSPGSRLSALQGNCLIGLILYARPPLENSSIRKNAVIKVNHKRGGDISQFDFQSLAVDVLLHKMEHHIPISVGIGRLECGFVVKFSAPSWILLRGGRGREIERSHSRAAVRGSKVRLTGHTRSKI